MKDNKSSKTWKKFLVLFIIILISSLLLSGLFWLWFGKEIHFSKVLELDFFNTVCGWFSIIGIGIALYQIAELKDRKEIQDEAKKDVKTKKFNEESLVKCETVKTGLQELQKKNT